MLPAEPNFIRLDVFKEGPGAQRAARKTGSGRRHKAPQKLGERGEYGTKEDHVYVAGPDCHDSVQVPGPQDPTWGQRLHAQNKGNGGTK